MDQIHEVEAFRSMLIQKKVVFEGETALLDLLCSDERAAYFFYDRYLSSPKPGSDEYYRRLACSALERNDMFSKDLVLLSLWAQYIEGLRRLWTAENAKLVIGRIGFTGFRRFDDLEIRLLVSSVRSYATERSCDFREDVRGNKIPAILRKKNGFHN